MSPDVKADTSLVTKSGHLDYLITHPGIKMLAAADFL